MTPNVISVTPANKITLEGLPYRYPMRTAVTLDAELRQIAQAVATGYPRLMIEPLKEETLCVAGYGPTLVETWKELTHPCISVSGAHDFLIERGFVPDYHAECDGRDHKTRHTEKPTRETIYLMATICNPLVWKQLEGCQVRLWHNANGQHVVDWISKHDPWSILVAGGSVVGLSAIHLGGILGFRKFRLFGFDGHFAGGVRHAGAHYGPPQKTLQREVGGRTWTTTAQMSNAADELLWLLRDAPSLQIEVMGDSMQKALLQMR